MIWKVTITRTIRIEGFYDYPLTSVYLVKADNEDDASNLALDADMHKHLDYDSFDSETDLIVFDESGLYLLEEEI